MAFPFGALPTLADYLHWIVGQGGYASDGGVSAQFVGPAMHMTKIHLGKRHVLCVGTRQTEQISAATIAHYDRRLGVVSPWSNLPNYK